MDQIISYIKQYKELIIKEFPEFNSSHEGYGIIKFHADCLWNKIINSEHNQFSNEEQLNDYVYDLLKSASYISATALHFLDSVCHVQDSFTLAIDELKIAENNFDAFNSKWEGFFVIKEELDELWEVIKLNPKKIILSATKIDPNNITEVINWRLDKRNQMLIEECVQVAAMGMKFVKGLLENNLNIKVSDISENSKYFTIESFHHFLGKSITYAEDYVNLLGLKLNTYDKQSLIKPIFSKPLSCNISCINVEVNNDIITKILSIK